MWEEKEMTRILICEWCGFINEEEMFEDEYNNNNCQCSCCGLYEVEVAEN